MKTIANNLKQLAQERYEVFMTAVNNRAIDGTDDRIIIILEALWNMGNPGLVALPFTAAEQEVVRYGIKRAGFNCVPVHNDLCEYYTTTYLHRLGSTSLIWDKNILFGYAEKLRDPLNDRVNYKVRVTDGVAPSVRRLFSDGFDEPQRKVEDSLEALREALGHNVIIHVPELEKEIRL